MAYHAADEVLARFAQAAALAGIVEQVLASEFAVLCSPQAHMDMRSASSLIEEGFGCEGRQQVEVACYAAHRLTHKADVIGGAQDGSMVNGKLLLRRAKLGVEEFNGDAPGFQRGQDGIDHLGLLIQPDAAVAEAGIGWHELPVLFAGQIKLVLDGGL